MRTLALLACVAAAAAAAAPKVKVVFYGESQCPYCIAAMGGPVNQTLTAPGLLDIMDFSYVPWGNAYYVTDSCGGRAGRYDVSVRQCWDKLCGETPAQDCFTGDIVCQHGAKECELNKVELCAIDASTGGPAQYMPFMDCLEVRNRDTKTCAAAAGLSYDAINTCLTTSKVDQLLVEAGHTTALIPGGHPGVPFITVNGRELSNTDVLLQTVCLTYTGTKPSGCPALKVTGRC